MLLVAGGCKLSTFQLNMFHSEVVSTSFAFRWDCLSLHMVRMSDVAMPNSKAGQDCLNSISIIERVPFNETGGYYPIIFYLLFRNTLLFCHPFLTASLTYLFTSVWGTALLSVGFSAIAASFTSLSFHSLQHQHAQKPRS